MAKKKAAKKTKKVGIIKEVQIDVNKNGCYFSRQVGHNGEIVYPSESYSSYMACFETANAVSDQLKVPLIQLARTK